MAGIGLRGKTIECMLSRTHDDLAVKLEKQFFWRRAAKRWLEIIDLCSDDEMRDLYVQRREHCISKANSGYKERNVKSSDKIDFVEAKRGIDSYFRKHNYGPVSNWYIDWS